MSFGDIGMQEHVPETLWFPKSFIASSPETTNILLLLKLVQNRIERTSPAA